MAKQDGPVSLRVGVIGANPDDSWAKRAIIPALDALPELELTAVATSRRATARASATHFGARHWFTDARALAACDDVDLVVVAVKVPQHDHLVRAALAEHKHVYCEWPLGVHAEEAASLALLADDHGVHHAVGLQARSSPAIAYARDLVADGFVGEVLACVATASFGFGRDPIAPSRAYLFDRSTGASFLTIHGGHLLDAVCHVVGEPISITGVAPPTRSHVVLTDGHEVPVTTPDVIAAMAELPGGGVLSAHLTSRCTRPDETSVVLQGTEGTLILLARGPRGIQIAPLDLLGARRGDPQMTRMSAPQRYVSAPVGPPGWHPQNVAHALRRFAADIRSGSHDVVDFHEAVRRHQQLAALARAAETGMRQDLSLPDRP